MYKNINPRLSRFYLVDNVAERGTINPAIGVVSKESRNLSGYRSIRYACPRKLWHAEVPVSLRAIGFKRLSSAALEVPWYGESFDLPLGNKQFELKPAN